MYHKLIDRFLSLLTAPVSWKRTNRDTDIRKLQEKHDSIKDLRLERSTYLKISLHSTVWFTGNLALRFSSLVGTYNVQLRTSNTQHWSLSVVQITQRLSFGLRTNLYTALSDFHSVLALQLELNYWVRLNLSSCNMEAWSWGASLKMKKVILI